MKRYWPHLVVAAGLCLLVGGVFYDVMFAGIPYQDPTPEAAADYARHAYIASVIRMIGFGVMLVGCVAGIVRLIVRRR